ncbi:MAG: RNA-binding S4 domain-containing protein [candidate division Zixibacteria bacterium]|nr:RNA-binding S4 domain-containing protein [candidate division Zixibacteria bacterium]
MRIDDFLSTVGVVKRRTVAKELGANGLIEVNGRKVKPAYLIKVRDIIAIKGSRPLTVEVLAIPTGSVPKTDREKYFKEIL